MIDYKLKQKYDIILIFYQIRLRQKKNKEMSITNQGQISDTNEIETLLSGIQNLTAQMSNTFQQAILKHEQQFVKTYRIKINQLTKLFDQLTKVLEDKFINNALTNRLNIVLKERDYFKYQCLKLNIQYQTALSQQNGLASQIVNVTDQMKIYKHLLEDQKIKNKELEKNAEKFKSNFSDIAYRTLTQSVGNVESKAVIQKNKNEEKKNKKIDLVVGQLQEKNEIIRNLKMKISELQLVVNQRQVNYFQRKQLFQAFKACTNSWKRDVLTKQRKSSSSLVEKKSTWNPQKLSVASKKDLLRYFFTSDQFLKFVEKLLFDPNFKVQFMEVTPEGQKFMIQNRLKLFDYMRKKKVICSPNLLER